MENRDKYRKIVIIQVILLVGALVSIAVLLLREPPQKPKLLIPAELRGLLLPEPKPLTSFELVDKDGQPFGLDQLKGRWSFVFFGYTHCPDVCPTSMGFLSEVFEQLKNHPGALDNTQALFISVDPKRDTPAVLKEYVPFFNQDFLGATGTPEAIAALAEQMWAKYIIEEDSDGDGSYLVDHTAAFFMVDPKGRLFAVFSAELQKDPAVVAKAFSIMKPMVE